MRERTTEDGCVKDDPRGTTMGEGRHKLVSATAPGDCSRIVLDSVLRARLASYNRHIPHSKGSKALTQER